jgi:hypothetical protein
MDGLAVEVEADGITTLLGAGAGGEGLVVNIIVDADVVALRARVAGTRAAAGRAATDGRGSAEGVGAGEGRGAMICGRNTRSVLAHRIESTLWRAAAVAARAVTVAVAIRAVAARAIASVRVGVGS